MNDVVQKRVMISQPMQGFPEDVIIQQRDEMRDKLTSLGYEVANTKQDMHIVECQCEARNVSNIPLYAFSKSIEFMSACDVLVLAPGWEHARGCRLEREIASAYGLEVLDYETYIADK